jgi:hypothetical protein
VSRGIRGVDRIGKQRRDETIAHRSDLRECLGLSACAWLPIALRCDSATPRTVGRIRIPAGHAGRRWLPWFRRASSTWPLRISLLHHPTSGLLAATEEPLCSRLSLLMCLALDAPERLFLSSEQRAEAAQGAHFGMLLKLRPPSRNVKLALSALCKARAACSHERLVGMVRYGRWSLRRERLSSASIVSWARTANGQMALAANIPSRAASSPKKPPPRPSTDLTAGAMVTLLTVPINCLPARAGKAPPSHQ